MMATNSGSAPQLVAAAAAGDLQGLLKMIEGGAGVNLSDDLGNTALLAAAENGKHEIIPHLLASKADSTMVNKQSMSALLLAARNGHLLATQKLLEGGTDSNQLDKDGRSAVLLAVIGGHNDVLKLLIEWNANVNTADFRGSAPLMSAVTMGNQRAVQLLLGHGAHVSTAVRSASKDPAITEMLTQRIRDLEAARNKSLRSAGPATVSILASWPVKLQKVKIPVITTEADALEQLVSAARHGLYLHIVAVLAHFPDTKVDDPCDGKIALIEAVCHGHEIEARVLLAAGASLEICYKEGPTAGWTPLMHAAAGGNFNVVARLVSSMQTTYKDKTLLLLAVQRAFDLAVERGHLPVARYLIANGAKVPELLPEPIREKLKSPPGSKLGAGVVIPDLPPRFGRMTAGGATLEGVKTVFELVAALKAEANWRVNPNGSIPLLEAAEAGAIEVLECLIFAGADLNQVYPREWTFAMEFMWRKYAKTQNAKDPDLHLPATADHWVTALTVAVNKAQRRAVQMMLNLGAVVHYRDLALAQDPVIAEMLTVMFVPPKAAPVVLTSNVPEEIAPEINVPETEPITQTETAIAGAGEPANVLDNGAVVAAAQAAHIPLPQPPSTATVANMAIIASSDPSAVHEGTGFKGLGGSVPSRVGTKEPMADVSRLTQSVHARIPAGETASAQDPKLEEALAQMTSAACAGNSFQIISTIANLPTSLQEHLDMRAHGAPALVAAVENHYLEAAKVLLVAGTDPDVKVSGWTPLMHAAYKGYRDCAELLMDYHADPNTKTKSGATAYTIAADREHDKLAQYLNDKMIETSKVKPPKGASAMPRIAPKVASLLGAKSIYDVAAAVANGAAVNEESGGTAPLFEAAKHGHVDVVKLLIHLGALINQELPWKVTPKSDKDTRAKKPSHLINIADITSATPLTLAVHHNHSNVVKLLLQEGANVHDRDLALATFPAIYDMLKGSKGTLDPGGEPPRSRPAADPAGDDDGNPTVLTASAPKRALAGSGDPSVG